jgi:predicted polyphosphate/ATP-dependent NAD kinase
MMKYKIGLIINPVAGMGGSVGLKGTDGKDILAKAVELGAQPKSNERVKQTLELIVGYKSQVTFYTGTGEMGASLAQSLGFETVILHQSPEKTTADDTMMLAKKCLENDCDLILFAGGDGTARNLLDAIGDTIPVLGVPAGCKIHSGVYSITPSAAAEVLKSFFSGELVDIQSSDVMDIDENLFRQGKVSAKRYGDMQVPLVGHFLQATKVGGIEDESLVIDDIAADVIENIESDIVVIGSGSTCAKVMEALGLSNTLLGVDVVQNDQVLISDATSAQLIALFEQNKTISLVITAIGGQGHLFGRGNQQLSPEFLRKLGKNNIKVIATKSKIKSLMGRPLVLDTGDSALDKQFAGAWNITTGYHDQIIYPAE